MCAAKTYLGFPASRANTSEQKAGRDQTQFWCGLSLRRGRARKLVQALLNVKYQFEKSFDTTRLTQTCFVNQFGSFKINNSARPYGVLKHLVGQISGLHLGGHGSSAGTASHNCMTLRELQCSGDAPHGPSGAPQKDDEGVKSRCAVSFASTRRWGQRDPMAQIPVTLTFPTRTVYSGARIRRDQRGEAAGRVLGSPIEPLLGVR